MAPNIKVDYEQLQQAAKRFHTAGEHVDEAMMKLMTSADEAATHWKGQAAGKFFPQWERIHKNMENLLNAMFISENYVNEIVKLFQEAEAKAAGGVRKRP